jgi:hypothetical protein
MARPTRLARLKVEITAVTLGIRSCIFLSHIALAVSTIKPIETDFQIKFELFVKYITNASLGSVTGASLRHSSLPAIFVALLHPGYIKNAILGRTLDHFSVARINSSILAVDSFPVTTRS